MSKYAIIQISHNQYLVEEGKEYTVPKMNVELGKFSPQVLLVKDKDLDLEKGKVELTILEHGIGEKVTTRKFKAKARFQKTVGHRKKVTKFKVEKIG
jgi:large subunit ribosomal protein L21